MRNTKRGSGMLKLPLSLERLGQRDVRRRFGLHLVAKLAGALIAVFVVKAIGAYLFTPAFAESAAPEPAPFVNPINTMWTLVAAFLVFFMQAGFMLLEAGFCAHARDGQRPARGHRRHVPLRHPLLGVGLRLHVRRGQRLHRSISTSSSRTRPTPTGPPASRSWRSGSSSSPSPTPAAPSPRAPWSAAPASWATSSTASASAASSTRSSATGPGARTAG